MIMDGLETLVAPTHHAFLLTESAAAAHFNVLSFDTCLFKPSSSFIATQHHHHHHHHPQLQHLNLQATATTTATTSPPTAATQTAAPATETSGNSNNNNNNSSSNSSSNNSTSSNSGHSNSEHSSSTRGAAGGPSITILNSNQQQGSGAQGGNAHTSEAAQGDLNTPVTTANDLPSFFGPSVVVEPPPITGELVGEGVSRRGKRVWE